MGQESGDTLFEFPCQFPIKVMAVSTADVKGIVSEALKAAKVDLQKVEMDVRVSAKGTYQSLTAIFSAESKAQLDGIYQALSAHPDVKMVL